MSIISLIEEIKETSGLRNTVSSDTVIRQLNRFLSNDLMEHQPFRLRKPVSFSRISEDSDLFVISSEKSRDISDINTTISGLEYPVDRYTTNNIYHVFSNTNQYSEYGFNLSAYYGNADERVIYHINKGDFVNIACERNFAQLNPLVLQGSDLRRLSNVYVAVNIFDSNNTKVASISKFCCDSSYTASSNGFTLTIDFKSRDLNITTSKGGVFTATIVSFVGNGNALYYDQKIYADRCSSNKLDTNILISCELYPRLVYGEEDNLDPLLDNHRNLIVTGTARNIAMMYNNQTVFESLNSVYQTMKDTYIENSCAQDSGWGIKNSVIDDPTDSSLGYYTYGRGGRYGQW